MEMRRERIDLARIVAEAVEDHRTAIESAGLTLTARMPGTPVWVMGDAVRLAQVVGQLLDNARKFTPSGDVSIEVSLGGKPCSP
jgi:signal transduction histidine kinase